MADDSLEMEAVEEEIDLPFRRYKAGERGMESLERRYLASKRMARLLKKAEARFKVEGLKPPEFIPIMRNKRMTGNTSGYYWTNHIDIAWYMGTAAKAKGTVWHELLHHVAKSIRMAINAKYGEPANFTKRRTLYHDVDKWIFFVAEGHGSHNSWAYKITCKCGYWWKSAKRRKWANCPRCKKFLVSPSRYRKELRLQPSAAYRYQPWKSNKKIVE